MQGRIPSNRATSAIVHAPFQPIGYVLVDAYLLLPAVWHADTQAPGTGDLVIVNLPRETPTAQMLLPLIAYPIADSGRTTTVPAETASPETALPEETSQEEGFSKESPSRPTSPEAPEDN